MNITSLNIKNSIIQKAKELGFEKIGFARYEVLEKESENLNHWINMGYEADMEWIERGFDKRRDIRNIVPDAKSVISLAYNYYTPFEHDELKPKISRYAWGKDYHKVLKKKLKELCNCEFEARTPLNPPFNQRGDERSEGGFVFKYYVDDGPVMDKAWAVKAGLGWQGKHSNVINPDFGSWFFICNIITNIEFDSYDSPIEDLCGSCTLCISACPTGAITDEYVVDSNKCLSYQTIENRGEIPNEIDLNGWLFGCDICQDVCPYNSPKYNRITKDESFYPLQALKAPPLNCERSGGLPAEASAQAGGFKSKSELIEITEQLFNTIFADSPIKRTKYKGWRRNLEKV
ncbi:MAG TPA: tRNA epoxyqueuosine(34) reductase QueG [Ignavibacteria bacterium]|jgi:epoxyqueuosine reductase